MEQDFEKALKELEDIVQAMEAGDLSLEDSLTRFERGMKLIRQCQTTLSKADQRVQVLLEKEGALEARPLEEVEQEMQGGNSPAAQPKEAPESTAESHPQKSKRKKPPADEPAEQGNFDDEIPF